MKRSRLKPVSDKRREERLHRAHVKTEAHRRDHYQCQAPRHGVPGQCWHPSGSSSPDCHEIIPRSAWRAGWLVLDNLVTVCRLHHTWIDANPDAAHELGLHGYSWERPDFPDSST